MKECDTPSEFRVNAVYMRGLGSSEHNVGGVVVVARRPAPCQVSTAEPHTTFFLDDLADRTTTQGRTTHCGTRHPTHS